MGEDRDRTHLRRHLGEFTKSAHNFHDESKRKCRDGLAPFYNELGNHDQCILGFFQLTSDKDEIFLVKLASGRLGSIRGNPDNLLKLRNLCPVLHSVYSSLKNDDEESLFNKVVRALFNIYQMSFKTGRQWWEQEQVVSTQNHEKYLACGRPKLRDLPTYVGASDSAACNKNSYRFFIFSYVSIHFLC